MSEQPPHDHPDDAIRSLAAHNARARETRGRMLQRRRLAGFTAVAVGLVVAGLGLATTLGAFDSAATTTSIRLASTPPAHPRIGSALTPTTAPATTAAAPAAPPPTTTSRPRPVPRVARFTVRAVRGDSWVEIRVGDAHGKVLYSGIVVEPQSITVSGRRLWARFGSVGNLDLLVDGKPVHTSHLGTVNAVVTRSGLRG